MFSEYFIFEVLYGFNYLYVVLYEFHTALTLKHIHQVFDRLSIHTFSCISIVTLEFPIKGCLLLCHWDQAVREKYITSHKWCTFLIQRWLSWSVLLLFLSIISYFPAQRTMFRFDTSVRWRYKTCLRNFKSVTRLLSLQTVLRKKRPVLRKTSCFLSNQIVLPYLGIIIKDINHLGRVLLL